MGGGYFSLTSLRLELDGLIRVSGGYDNNTGPFYDAGGAGGGVHLQVNSLAGAGSIYANGANALSSSYSSGAGGRISIIAGDISEFIDVTDSTNRNRLQARGGTGVGSRYSAPGTVFIQDTEFSNGVLIVDSNGVNAEPNSTPIQPVGKHLINFVMEIEPGLWQLGVDYQFAYETNESEGRGLQGLQVDLDIDSDSVFYTVLSNDLNSLYIETADDLSAYQSKTLIGIHIFDQLYISGGANVDFDTDRIEVVNTLQSEVTSDSTIQFGEANDEWLQYLLDNE